MRFFSTWNICNGSTRNTSYWRGKGSPCKKMDYYTVIHHLRLKTVLSKAKEDELLQITSGLKRAHYLIDHLSVFVCFILICFVFCFVFFLLLFFVFVFWIGEGDLLVSNSKFSKWPFKSLNLGKIFLFYIFKMFTLSACVSSKWLNVWW